MSDRTYAFKPCPFCGKIERLNLYAAMEQSKRDARDGETSVVMHRKNREDWLVTMRLEDWMQMYEKGDGKSVED